MPRVSVPVESDPMMHVWGSLAPELTRPAAAYSGAVYASPTFSLREMEAARITIAGINDCTICLGWRSGRDVPGRAEQAAEADEDFYAAVLDRRLADLAPRERLSAVFAEKFCIDHRNIDESLWRELHEHFTDDELVELALSFGAWLALGRFNRVFDIDGGCRVDLPG